jgi:hypothetical protein
MFALGAGIAGGWAMRSLSDSPHGAGVKLLEIGLETKDRVGRWAAVEGERFEDMLAEARSRVDGEKPGPKRAAKASGRDSKGSAKGPGRRARTET